MLAMPEWLAYHVNFLYYGWLQVRKEVTKQIDAFLADPGLLESTEHEIIYHRLMNVDSKDGHDDSPSRTALIDEAIVLLLAGSDTVGHACEVGVFHALDDPSVRSKLVRELLDVWPDKESHLGYEALGRLPYLVSAHDPSALRIQHISR